MKLKLWLKQNRWSRPAFADALSVSISRQSIDAYVNGIRKPGKLIARAVFNFTHGQVRPQDFGLPKNFLNPRKGRKGKK